MSQVHGGGPGLHHPETMAPAFASDGIELAGAEAAQIRQRWEAHCAGWKVLDDAILAYLATQVDVPSRWLLIQTLATAASAGAC